MRDLVPGPRPYTHIHTPEANNGQVTGQVTGPQTPK